MERVTEHLSLVMPTRLSQKSVDSAPLYHDQSQSPTNVSIQDDQPQVYDSFCLKYFLPYKPKQKVCNGPSGGNFKLLI